MSLQISADWLSFTFKDATFNENSVSKLVADIGSCVPSSIKEHGAIFDDSNTYFCSCFWRKHNEAS